MAYLGAQPNKTLTKTTSQSFNGTGSATTFTLNRAVNTEEELEVFVENVQQEPGSGKSYTASGTTLTFDEAPPSGTGNIYVIYRGQAEVTTRLEHDANQALSATTGTFSGNLALNGESGEYKIVIESPGTPRQNFIGMTSYDNLVLAADEDNAGTGSNIRLQVDGTERVRVTEDKVQFNVDAKVGTDNSHDLGASGARWKDLYLSGGMYVGGTTASHHFDDYEEGEFDITTARSGVTGSDTVPTITGQYVKIGRMVFIDFTRKGSTSPYTRNGTGGYASGQSVTITSNLPFSPNSTNSERLGKSRALTDHDSLMVGWRSGSTVIYLGTGDDNNYAPHNNATTSTAQSNVTIQCQFCYFTTS